ncbi:MAG TPA: tetratricopeptide repeat protein [Paenalcaligenes hominis]|uniref:Tetratricopeptide repeat protein n=1 Tax=Paenalcaligenes hominis TaxID=643674 RepID=A0A9D2VEF5_9BURK|nr:tetratricopeptide repeat protein [Paenalcaligenes hominis]
MNLKSLFFRTVVLSTCLSSAAMASEVIELSPVEHIQLRSDGLPMVTLSPDILYRILVGEVAVQQGDFDTASQTFLSLARDTADPRFAQRAFQFSMADNNLSRGIAAAKEWSILAPNDPEAKATALALEASAGKTTGLAQTLYQRISQAPDKEQAIIQAMTIISKMVDSRLALDVLEQALPNDVRHLTISHLALADIAWTAQQPERALQESRLALAQEPDSELAMQRVLEYGLGIDEQAVIEQAEQFIEANSDLRDLALLLINRLVDLKRYDQALYQLKLMQKRNPEDFDLQFTEAEINIRAERYDTAVRLLNEYINVQTQRRQSLNDDRTLALSSISDARLSLVQIAEKQNNLSEAIRQLDLIEEPTLQFQAKVHRAVLEARLGDIHKANRTLDALGVLGRRDQAVVDLTRASILRESGRTDEAVAVLERADKELPDTPEIKYDLAMLYSAQGRYEELETLLRQVIDLQPHNANAYNALGYTFVDQNENLDEAQGLLEQALELEPNNPYILDSVGWYFYRIGDYQAALEYLVRAFELLPDAEVAAHLGEVLWAKGRQDEAREVWRKALKPDNPNYKLLRTMQQYGVSPK